MCTLEFYYSDQKFIYISMKAVWISVKNFHCVSYEIISTKYEYKDETFHAK